MVQPPFAVEQLFDDLGDEEYVSYPPLTRDELVGLGDEPLLRDIEDLTWWSDLDERTRTEVSATAQRGLLARGLVALDPAGATRIDVTPRVRTVLALRSAPAFVTLVGNVGRPSPTLRCYGVLGPEQRVAVLVEARIMTGIAEYLLCRPAYAAGVVTRFLLAPPDASDPDARPAPDGLGTHVVQRRLELFPPGSLDRGQRFLASAGTAAAALAPVGPDGHAGQARSVSERSVLDLVAATWGEQGAQWASAADATRR